MTPYYAYAKGKPYFYYDCTVFRKTSKTECEMKPVPAIPLEDVVAKRMMELSLNQDMTLDLIEKTSETSALRLEQLTRSKSSLVRKQHEVTGRLDSRRRAVASTFACLGAKKLLLSLFRPLDVVLLVFLFGLQNEK